MGEEGKGRGARWNNLKRDCKQVDLPQLQTLLREKQIELRKRIARQMAGGKMKGYTPEDKGQLPIKVIKKEIAIIQTFINQKMQGYKQ